VAGHHPDGPAEGASSGEEHLALKHPAFSGPLAGLVKSGQPWLTKLAGVVDVPVDGLDFDLSWVEVAQLDEGLTVILPPSRCSLALISSRRTTTAGQAAAAPSSSRRTGMVVVT
jgi:hypothetical protein